MPYMIQDSASFLWSTGGIRPKFVAFSRAKVWRTLGQVKGHLAIFRTFQGVNQVPSTWMVIPVELQVVYASQLNARELVQENCDKQAAKQAQYKNAREKEQADRELAELKRLTKKYKPAHAPGAE